MLSTEHFSYSTVGVYYGSVSPHRCTPAKSLTGEVKERTIWGYWAQGPENMSAPLASERVVHKVSEASAKAEGKRGKLKRKHRKI